MLVITAYYINLLHAFLVISITYGKNNTAL
jgi:hypothetical protein